MPVVRRQPLGVAAAGLSGAALLAALSPGGAAAQNTEWNRYTLEGLVGVHVVAETNDGCQGAGLAAESVRADAETALRDAGVPLLAREEMLATPGLPEVRVALECGGGVSGVVGYAVSVRVQQATQMIRDTQITLSETVTWYVAAVGVAEAASTASAVNTALRAKLAEFAEAFEAANAKES